MACERTRWADMVARLRTHAPNEACTFALVRPSTGIRRLTLLVGDALWPIPGDIRATPYSLELSADYISRALDAAIDAGENVGVALIHTHPDSDGVKGVGTFSSRDDWYDLRLFPTATLGRPSATSASIVVGSGADLSARLWWDEGLGVRTQPVQIVRVVGPELRLVETPASSWRDHLDPEMMDRSTRIWGIEGRRRLQNLRIGIVGLGGTGSIVLLALATMGVGQVETWDRDVVRKENLHRLLGARSAMVGRPKAMALAELAREVATARPFSLVPHKEWGTSKAGIQRLKDCDLVFCCVDKFAPRVPLNDLAYAHLIPVIDMASWIHPATNVVDALMTHAHVWSPGIPCAWCRGTLSSRRLTREAQGVQRDAELRIPYGLPLDATEGVEPSVLPLNMTGVSLALMEFMQVVLQVTDRTPRDLKLILPQWELDESDLGFVPDCACQTDRALGDTVLIRPVEPLER